MAAPPRATGHSRTARVAAAHTVATNRSPQALARRGSACLPPADAAPPPHPCSPAPTLARSLSATLPSRVAGPGAATRSSRACLPASRAARASSATGGRNFPATARVLATAAKVSSPPARPVFFPAHPSNAPDPAPPDGARNCVRAAPRSAARATLPHTRAAAAPASSFPPAAAPSSDSSALSRSLAHRERLAVNPPLFLLLAARAQILVQSGQIFYFRHRHQVVPPEIAHFAFHAALLVAARRVAKLRLESPMRTESDQPVGLLALVSAQDLFHRALQVVVAQPPEHSAEIVEGLLMRFQKSLLRGMEIRGVKRPAARHAAHRKKIRDLAALGELHRGFVPIHLGLHAPVVTLRHERLARRNTQLLLS